MRRRELTVAIALLAVTFGCGSRSPSAPDVIQAGQVDLRLPTGWTVTARGAARPANATNGPGASATTPAAASAAGAAPTIPLAKEDPTTAFFKATSGFGACLRQLGVKFIGAPNPKTPNAPTNDPNYIKSLATCAASSHILQALKDFQTAQDNQTPAQIQQTNKAYLAWRDCMIGRGWVIPTPKPDSQGKLFSIGGASAIQLTPPPGADLITSGDIQACASQVQKSTPTTIAGG